MFIYLIVNRETGKYYVGQHKGNNLQKYLQQKFHHAQSGVSGSSHLFNSMRRHPNPRSWSIHALRSDITDREELDRTERDFIRFLRATDPGYGYNICRGGEGRTGPQSEEEKKKHRLASIKVWQRPGHRERISRTSTEIWQRPGHRENHIAKTTGQKRSPQTIATLTAIRRARLGEEISPQTRKRMHDSRIGAKRSEESRRKQGQSTSGPLHCNYGKRLPESVRAKMREAALHATPERIAARDAAFSKNWVKRPRKPCSVGGCGRLAKARGLCNSHLQRVYRHGNILKGTPLSTKGPLPGTYHWIKENGKRLFVGKEAVGLGGGTFPAD